MNGILTDDEYGKYPEGIFRSGLCSDSPTGCNIDNTGKILKWIAVKFRDRDWAIYLGYPDQSEERIFRHGVKTRDESNIRRLVPCSDVVFSFYNI